MRASAYYKYTCDGIVCICMHVKIGNIKINQRKKSVTKYILVNFEMTMSEYIKLTTHPEFDLKYCSIMTAPWTNPARDWITNSVPSIRNSRQRCSCVNRQVCFSFSCRGIEIGMRTRPWYTRFHGPNPLINDSVIKANRSVKMPS